MKVLIDTSPLLAPKTGIGYYTSNICEQLKRYDDVKLVYTHSPEGKDYGSLIKKVSTPLKRVMKGVYPERLAAKTYNFLMSRWSLESSVKSGRSYLEDIDIFHETCHEINFKPLDPKWIFIADIHDLSPLKHPQWHMKQHVDSVKNSFDSIRKADHFLVRTNFIKNELCEYINVSESKVTVVPNAIASTYSMLSNKELVRNFITKYTEKDYILYVGTVEPRKNLETLIRAYNILLSKEDVDLVIAGGLGWHFSETVDLPKELGISDRVKFTGYVSEQDLLYLYNGATIFVYPSLYEGFGIPPIEAMACGVPVITSNTSSLPEVVGDAALTFEPHDMEELSYLMEKLLFDRSLSQSLKEKGFIQYRKFNWIESANIIRNVYRKVCKV